MKFRMLFVAMLAMCGLAFGQGAVVIISELDYSLTDACGGGGCIPGGTTVEIRLDVAPAGIGPEDPLADVGPAPQQWTDNSFQTNPDDIGSCGGFFRFSTWATNSAAPNPAGPFYMVIQYGAARWTSDETAGAGWSGRTFGSGPWEWDPVEWNCETIQGTCDNQPPTVALAPGTDTCFPTCANHTTDVIADCPEGQPPLATIDGNPIPTGDWTYSGGTWHYTYVGTVDNGQVCFRLEGCTPPPCNPTPFVNFIADNSDPMHAVGWPAQQCIQVCPGSVTTVIICSPDGHPFDMSKPPLFEVKDGCLPVDTRCDVVCPAGHAVVIGVNYNTAGCWEILVGGQLEGCVCFEFNGFLAAGIRSFDAIAMDNSVKIAFETASETDVASFEIDRAVKGHSDYTTLTSIVAEHAADGGAYSYVDANAVNGTTYTYRLYSVSASGDRSDVGTVEATPSFNAAVITEYALHQNFPNPFNPTTQITFDLVNENFVTLNVFNVNGQVVGSVVNGTMDAGRHTVNFDAGNLTSGLYFYTVKIGNEFTATKKMMLVK